ncbi:hypothetical protein [Burkholderia sp. Ac-20365]|uniref:hypothetical protein n=1 Tax=Burkholderia sp. Ac-20365 TaxID=2703897 RepID=UPI00197C1B4F|nr:hypothetical protein [Burkholderia sp. Ac-20365]MBN3761222.1 hypothetical protein [Burkholderia sp. Ac-20365]
MKTKIISITLVAPLMLAACGSSKDASNGNFEKALDAHFAKNCIVAEPFVAMADGHRYPLTVRMQAKAAFISQEQVDKNNANITRPLDALVKAGVLSATEGTAKEKPMFGGAEYTVPTKVYALTDAGKKASANPESTALCVGHLKVDEIIRFTQPGDFMGQKVSQVSFTASPVDVPDWAKTADFQSVYTGVAKTLSGQTKDMRPLVLASDGWIDAVDFNK